MSNKQPRRIRMDLWWPAETAIHNAIQEVERMPADVDLTNVVVALLQAQRQIADWIDDKADTAMITDEYGSNSYSNEPNPSPPVAEPEQGVKDEPVVQNWIIHLTYQKDGKPVFYKYTVEAEGKEDAKLYAVDHVLKELDFDIFSIKIEEVEPPEPDMDGFDYKTEIRHRQSEAKKLK